MPTRRLLVLALALLAMPLAAQRVPLPPPLDPDLPKVAIETTAGRFVVALETKKAPITAGNFLKYVDEKRLDGIIFYRVVKVDDRFGFVQFGVNGEPKRVLPPIKHEPTTLTGISHLDGTLSVARFAPGTARGDFTIMLGDQSGSFDADPSKPGDNLGYAAFGHVVEGMDVVVKILDGTVSPDKTVAGSFKGEVPEAPVKVIKATRIRL